MAVNRLLQEMLSKSGPNLTSKTDVTRRLSPLQNFFLFDFIPASARLFGIWTKIYPGAPQAVSSAGKRMSRNCELTRPSRSFLAVCIKLRCSDLVDQLDLNDLLRGIQRELRLISCCFRRGAQRSHRLPAEDRGKLCPQYTTSAIVQNASFVCQSSKTRESYRWRSRGLTLPAAPRYTEPPFTSG
jgi:hypothetical protein